MAKTIPTTQSNKKRSTSHAEAAEDLSNEQKVSVITKPKKTRQNRSTNATRQVEEQSPEPIQITVDDKSHKCPQRVEVKVVYNPEKEVKYLMTDMENAEIKNLLIRLWKFYRHIKKARKLEKKLAESQIKMEEALSNKEEE